MAASVMVDLLAASAMVDPEVASLLGALDPFQQTGLHCILGPLEAFELPQNPQLGLQEDGLGPLLHSADMLAVLQTVGVTEVGEEVLHLQGQKATGN